MIKVTDKRTVQEAPKPPDSFTKEESKQAVKVTDKRSSVFLNEAQEKRILEARATNRWNSLPRYIKRAFHSRNKLYIEKAIIKAIRNGWTLERLKECVPQDKVRAVKKRVPDTKPGGQKADTPTSGR